MNRQDLILATIRTAVPGAIAFLLAQLVAAIPAVQGWIVTVDEVLAISAPGWTFVAIVNAAVMGLAIAGYYWAARKLGARWPALERWLLGRSSTPSYEPRILYTEADSIAQLGYDPAKGRHEA